MYKIYIYRTDIYIYILYKWIETARFRQFECDNFDMNDNFNQRLKQLFQLESTCTDCFWIQLYFYFNCSFFHRRIYYATHSHCLPAEIYCSCKYSFSHTHAHTHTLSYTSVKEEMSELHQCIQHWEFGFRFILNPFENVIRVCFVIPTLRTKPYRDRKKKLKKQTTFASLSRTWQIIGNGNDTVPRALNNRSKSGTMTEILKIR